MKCLRSIGIRYLIARYAESWADERYIASVIQEQMFVHASCSIPMLRSLTSPLPECHASSFSRTICVTSPSLERMT